MKSFFSIYSVNDKTRSVVHVTCTVYHYAVLYDTSTHGHVVPNTSSD